MLNEVLIQFLKYWEWEADLSKVTDIEKNMHFQSKIKLKYYFTNILMGAGEIYRKTNILSRDHFWWVKSFLTTPFVAGIR